MVIAPTGPPGLTCVSHLDHFDCTNAAGDESTCELIQDVWMCETFSAGEGETSGSSSGAGSCVVHGGARRSSFCRCRSHLIRSPSFAAKVILMETAQTHAITLTLESGI